MTKKDEQHYQQTIFETGRPATRDSGPVTCLGITFPNDEERRKHFLGLLRTGLEELREKLAVPFVSVEDTYTRLKSLEHWPVGTDEQLRDLAQRIAHAASSTRNTQPVRDILGLYKDEVGFPIGSDEDILALSDPPYYTACPNPFVRDFIAQWSNDQRGLRTETNTTPLSPHSSVLSPESYHREPFTADVSEGKNDPIYNAHSYHTKVPHKAIMRYILHYTEPGDIVFDGFCGTGMTGVAAQMCGDKAVVESLGYRVDKDGTILQQEIDENGKAIWKPFSKLGARRAILNDLSPAATFIAYNYNTPVDVQAFEREAKRILKEVEDECDWMYETIHTDGKTKGKIDYTVWSDVFICPDCSNEVIFWEAAVDKKAGSVRDEFPCPHCGAILTKRRMERAWESRYDVAIKQTIRQAKQVPVLINYTVNGKRAEKTPDENDLALIAKIEASEIPYWFPTVELPDGFNTRQPRGSHGITHVHHFYTKRNLWVLGALRQRATAIRLHSLHYWLNSLEHGLGKRVKHGDWSFPMSVLSGTLYIPALSRENSPLYFYDTKYKKQYKVLRDTKAINNPISTYSSEKLIGFHDSSIDYIFVDPPFGANINYSELNFLWESWLKVWTNNKPEAIENRVQGKGPNEYRQLMTACFKEAYRVLKPGRWMTVEFSNTKASVWNSIQTALTEAGFIVANVSALDKKQGSFKAVTTPTAVKQDLVISAYKPNGGFEERFQKEAQTEEGVWDFVRTHLKYLPVTKKLSSQSSVLVTIPERDPRILYDQMVAYYVRKGYPVPLNSAEFQEGLSQRFSYRDGMYFLPEQVAEYDKKKMTAGSMEQMALFVSDEVSAIQWLKQQLFMKPQTFQELHPQFLKKLGGWQRYEKPLELSELLEQNFLCYDGKGKIPSQIVSWMRRSSELRPIIEAEFQAQRIELAENLALETSNPELHRKAADRWYVPDPNKAGDLEKLRERSLLKEFEDYRASTQRRLKVFRLEAVRAGFKNAWQERDYATIVAVARKIPENILQEDPKLLMWFDQAVTRTGEAENR